MERKKLAMIGAVIGGYVGAYIPSLWGAGSFSFSSLFLSAAVALLGIWVGFKLGSE